jgi:hypothetical protein
MRGRAGVDDVVVHDVVDCAHVEHRIVILHLVVDDGVLEPAGVVDDVEYVDEPADDACHRNDDHFGTRLDHDDLAAQGVRHGPAAAS